MCNESYYNIFLYHHYFYRGLKISNILEWWDKDTGDFTNLYLQKKKITYLITCNFPMFYHYPKKSQPSLN